MSDAKLLWYDFGADISVINGDLVHDDGLASAVLISLFSDARATAIDALPAGETKRRGWWGLAVIAASFSLLWLISREKTLQERAEKAREFAFNALQWLKEDDIAEEVGVEATLIKPFSLQLIITITRGTAQGYAYLWDAVEEYSQTTVQNTSIKLRFIQ